jgi:hypothetical protein
MIMCGGGGGDSKLAKQAAEQEEARQRRIEQGTRELEVMFSGGARGAGKVGKGAAFDPNATYYDNFGNPIQLADPGTWRKANPTTPSARMAGTPMPMTPFQETRQYHPNAPQTGEVRVAPTLGSPTAAQADRLAMQEQFEKLAGGGLYTGTQQVKGFGPEFFDKIYQAQLDYALPQVDKQYADAQKQLEYALARQSISASSQAGQLQAELQGQRNLALQGEQDKATQVRTRQQQAVEDERAELTRLLQQTGDVESMRNMAAARSNMLKAAPALETVGPLFQNATGTLADLVVSPAARSYSEGIPAGGYGRRSRAAGKVVT